MDFSTALPMALSERSGAPGPAEASTTSLSQMRATSPDDSANASAMSWDMALSCPTGEYFLSTMFPFSST